MIGEFVETLTDDLTQRVMLGEVSLGQIDTIVANAIANFVQTHGPAIAEELAAYMAPLTQKAIDTAKPAVYQALTDYTPTFAAISGGMLALAVYLGIWIARRKQR